MRLHTKLILVLVPLIAAPLGTLGWVAYSQQRDRVELDAVRQLNTIVDQVHRQVQGRLESATADLVLFANSGELERYLLVEDESQRFQLLQPSLLKLLASYQRSNPEYYEIRILLPDGYEDTRATIGTLPNIADEEADTDYVRAAMQAKQDLFLQIVRNPDNDRPVAMISHRLASIDPNVDPILAKPRLRGYLFVTMSLEFLQEQVDDIQRADWANLFFTNGSGQTLFAPSGTQPPATLDAASFGRLMADARVGAPTRINHIGKKSLIKAKAVTANLAVFISLPESEILASTRHLAQMTVALIVGSILTIAALLYGFLRFLLITPMVRLGEAAQEIGLGRRVLDVGIRRKDEIGQLAQSFEEMSRNLQQSHEQIAHLAHHDSLTGLPNRRMFKELLERSLVDAHHRGETLAVLFLDLDDFKRVNDSLGHHVGDELLRTVTQRLIDVVRSDDHIAKSLADETMGTVARLGGDEFIVLLPRIGQSLNAATVASRILDSLSEPIQVASTDLDVNASIGITVFPDDAQSADELIKNADIAMYHAKEQGKNHFQFYTQSLNNALLKRVVMEASLRKGLAGRELFLHYQPQVDAHTGEIVGAEALVRWSNLELGTVSPGEFIPLAEDTGLIMQIGELVLREACRQNKAWQDAGLPCVPVAVNISAKQISDSDLRDIVERVLRETGLDPQYLDLELTESGVMRNPDEAVTTLLLLKELGVHISMDDFGTGYSSLSILKRLPIDILKIDQSFVRDLTTDANDAAITTAIIAMARSLDLMVTAEGVEQADQLAFLQARGCDRVQGFLISRPVPAHDMTMLLATKCGRPGLFNDLISKAEPGPLAPRLRAVDT